jgi:hypothetical protein
MWVRKLVADRLALCAYDDVVRRLFTYPALALLVYACGSGGSGTPDAGTDAAPDVTVTEAGAPDTAPDVAPDVPIDNWVPPLPPYARSPIFDYQGGPLLTAVKVITVSFTGDDAALITRMQELDDTITSTPWWTASTAEYCELPSGPCIGPGTGAGHVVLNETAPTSLVDTDDGTMSTVVSFIQTHITNGDFPLPDDQTIYVIYFPSGTSITYDGEHSCSSFGAYHYSATFNLPDGGTQEGVYAIEPRCTGEPYITQAASHELIEAATDAHPGKVRGYVMEDMSWQYYGDEVGDICDHPWGFDVMDITTIDGGAPFTVQRGWSNLSALAGHDPCVIPPSDHPYFNTAVQSGTQAIYLGVGDSTTIQLQGFSDGAMPDWNITAVDMGSHYGAGNVLNLSIDQSTMNNGQTANLTITVTAKPTITWMPYLIDNKDSNGHEHQWGASVYLE